MGAKVMSKEEFKETMLITQKSKKVHVKNVTNLREKEEDVKIILLNTATLASSQSYQRDVDYKKIAYIVSNYDKHQFGIPKVSYRDGEYYVYDGQHRIAAYKAMNGDRDGFIQCEVHFNLTYEDEAKYFAEQYAGSTKIDIIYKWRALFEAKEEPVYTIVNAVREIGIEVEFTKSKAVNRIVALSELNKMWLKLKEVETLKVLSLMKKAWGKDVNCYNKNILDGIKEFFFVYGDEIDEDMFVSQMKKIEPVLIEAKGKSDMVSKGGLKFAKVIWDQYNRNLRINRLDYKFKG